MEALVAWMLADVIEGTTQAFDASEKRVHVEKEVRLPTVQWIENDGL
jgi:hypothetical protein